MVDYGMFFDSKSGDRAYDAEAFREWCRRFFTNGIVKSGGYYGFSVSSAGGRDISVAPGIAFINGAMKILEEAVTITVPESSASEETALSNIVIEYNQNRDTRDIIIKADSPPVSGGAAAPTRDAFVWQLVIARVDAHSGAITPADITDTRSDASVCGFMRCSVEEPNAADIANALSEYLDLLGDEQRAKYSEARAELTPKINYEIYAALDALRDTRDGMSRLLDDSEKIAHEISSLDEYADAALERYKEILKIPSVAELGTSLNALSFSADDLARTRKLILVFMDDTGAYTSIMLDKVLTGWGYEFRGEYSMDPTVKRTYTQTRSPTTGQNYTQTTTYLFTTTFTDYAINIRLAGSGVYTPSEISTVITTAKSDMKWEDKTTYVSGVAGAGGWRFTFSAPLIAASSSDVKTTFTASNLTVVAIY